MKQCYLLYLDDLCSITGGGYPVAVASDLETAQSWQESSDSFQRRHYETVPFVEGAKELKNL